MFTAVPQSLRSTLLAGSAAFLVAGLALSAPASAQAPNNSTAARNTSHVIPSTLQPGPSTAPSQLQRLGQPELPPRIPPRTHEPRQIDNPRARSTASINTYLTYHVGYTQTSPRIYILFWGDWTSSGDIYNLQNYLWRFYSGIGGSSLNQIVTQYGYSCGFGAIGCANGVRITNPTGQLKNYAYDRGAIPLHPTTADLQAEAGKAAAYFGDRSVNAQYVIALARGHVDQTSLTSGDCAWHNYTWSNSSPISYTSLPYMPDRAGCGTHEVNSGSAGVLDGVSIIAGHEYNESETDPFLNGWFDAHGDEAADKCLQWTLPGYFRDLTLATGTFAVQPTFSNYHLQQNGSACRFS